jgi:hypothetical protein
MAAQMCRVIAITASDDFVATVAADRAKAILHHY